MPKRVDLYGQKKRSKKPAKRKQLTPARIWQVVAGVFMLFTTFAAFLWLIGADFSSEYRQTPLFSTTGFFGGEPRGTRLSACGFVRALTPDSLDEAIPCTWWNLGSFYIIPLIALFHAIRMTVFRR